FGAMTGSLFRMNIRGRDGQLLQDKCADGAHTYLGLMPSGCPNLFMITGPQSPSVLSNMIVSIEHHSDIVIDMLDHTREQGMTVVGADQEAEEKWVEHVAEVGNSTLFPRANSWYMGRNI